MKEQITEDIQQGFMYNSGEGERIPWPKSDFLIKASAMQTGGSISVIEEYSPEGKVPLHVHHHEDEIFYILSGGITITCGDKVFEAAKGAFVYLPRGVPHAQQINEGGARKLIITVPAGIEGFFKGAGAMLSNGTKSNEAWMQLSEAHGIEWL